MADEWSDLIAKFEKLRDDMETRWGYTEEQKAFARTPEGAAERQRVVREYLASIGEDARTA